MKNNPIYIMEQELQKHFPNIEKPFPNYVINKILDALNAAGFDVIKVENKE